MPATPTPFLVLASASPRRRELLRQAGYRFSVEPVEVVDAVGAGDAFTAGLIAGLLRGRDPARIARAANLLGAAVAARAGAMPDVDDFLRNTGALR